MYRSIFFLVALAVSANVVWGSTSYHFTGVMGDSGEVSGTVFYLGSSFRIEFESSEDVYISQYPIRLSNDNGATIFYLNSQDKTYFKSHRSLGNSGFSKPDVAITSDGEGEVIAGFTTKKYVLKGSCALKVLGGAEQSSRLYRFGRPSNSTLLLFGFPISGAARAT